MIGIDVVEIDRLRSALGRTEGLEERLFTADERTYCSTKHDPVVHMAGTLAAKEAVIKAARLGPLVAWAQRIEIDRDGDGVPGVTVAGRGATVQISISHDGPVAVAVALSCAG